MAQIVDHQDLITAFQPGDLPASERIVRIYQNEILRTSFLLTGTAEGSVLLARDTFLSYFRRLVRGDVAEDPRLGLLEQTGKCFLLDPEDRPGGNGDRADGLLEGTISFDAGQNRYQVEDDRSRVLSLLDLLDRPTRLGVILRDFNALEEEPVCQIIDEVPYNLRQQLHPARDRIRDAAGVGPDHSVRELLVNAATSAPRPNLWPEVLGPLEDFYAEEEERRQRLTYLAAGVVGVLLLLAGLWLFDLLPFGSGDDGAVAIIPTAGPTATPTATPEPTITPTPIPELSSFAIPQGDVPGKLLMTIRSTSSGSTRSDYGYLDIESGAFNSFDLESWGSPTPDGRAIVGYRIDVTPSAAEEFFMVALDSDTAEVLWEIEIPRTSYSLAIAGDRIYLAALVTPDGTAEELPAPVLRAYALESGELVETWDDVIPQLQTAVSNFVDVTLFASPDGERLFIAVEEFGSGPAIISSRSLASFSLPEMTFESSSIQSDSTASRQFPTDFSFGDAYVTPDGAFVYRVNAEAEEIQFRSSDLSEDLDLPMPFVQEREEGENIQWITSNDGRYLYVLAMRRAEVVIVDLLARRVDRIFPLAFGESMVDQQPVLRSQRPVGLGFGAGLTISQDGQTLYLIGVSPRSSDGQIEASNLWTIDLETWTVAGTQTFPGFLYNATILGESLILLSDPQPTANVSNRRLSVVDAETGEVLSEYDGADLPDWAGTFFTYALNEYYRFEHARAPAVDGVAYETLETASTLSRISVVATSETIPVGQSFDMAVRVLNPVDGQRLTEELDSVRFDENSTVILRLIHEEGAADEVILVANQTDLGQYSASTSLLATGFWDAEVTITGVSGVSWSVTIDKVFQIVPSWEASDGRRYILDVSTDPERPTVDQEVAVSARFVEVNSGVPLPPGVDILGGFPEMIRIVFDSDGSGVANAALLVGEDGVYTGEEVFWQAGDWLITVDVRNEAGDSFDVEAGTVTVVE